MLKKSSKNPKQARKVKPNYVKPKRVAARMVKPNVLDKLGLKAGVPRPEKEEAFRPPAYSRGNFGMPKKMCPFCNSTDVSPDSMGGDVISWTCRSCGNSFPAPLEAPHVKSHHPDEEPEYEEDEDLK